MHADLSTVEHAVVGSQTDARLGSLLICDLADSTGLIERLGDRRAAALIRRHDQLARDTLHRHHGQEIDKTDGFLILFEQPIQAVAFALDYQRLLQRLGQELGESLAARVGIHVGEVLTWRNRAEDVAQGAKPLEVEGLAKAIAARLMSLARAGQILLSDAAYQLAHAARAELDPPEQLRWTRHGLYQLQGVSRQLLVYEVGSAESSSRPPKAAIKARRVQPWWHWKPLYAVMALLTGALLIYWVFKPTPAIALAERDWLVLAPLNNRTGDVRFDQSLDSVIRVGLEQSIYLNLVSENKLRQTLLLMRRASNSRVDREVGSELALRTGARAMLLPSLAEIGGKYRFSLELIDPISRTTVYSHFVDSNDESSLIADVDSALEQARADLGEPLGAIEQHSLALADLTSNSIDALRAYGLAMEAKSLSQIGLANELLEQALQLDPEFAMAMSLQAVLRFSQGDSAGAAEKVTQAQRLARRLSPWEQTHLDAVSAFYRGAPDVVNKWRALVARYPDRHSAHHTLSLTLAAENDFEAAWQAIQPALTPLNGSLRNSQYQAGMFALALGNTAEALDLFRQAEQAGVAGDVSAYGLAEYAAGNLQRALTLLQAGQQAEVAEHAALNALAEISIRIREGELDQAWTGLRKLRAQRSELSFELNQEIALATASYECLVDDANAIQPPWTEDELRATEQATEGERQRQRFRSALWQAVSLHCENRLARDRPLPTVTRRSDDQFATQLAFDWLEFEQGLHSGRARQVIEQGDAMLNGRELWLLHFTRRHAFEVLDDPAGVESEARWLQQHEGLSLVEFSKNYSALDLINGLVMQRRSVRWPNADNRPLTSGPPQ